LRGLVVWDGTISDTPKPHHSASCTHWLASGELAEDARRFQKEKGHDCDANPGNRSRLIVHLGTRRLLVKKEIPSEQTHTRNEQIVVLFHTHLPPSGAVVKIELGSG